MKHLLRVPSTVRNITKFISDYIDILGYNIICNRKQTTGTTHGMNFVRNYK